MPEQRNVLFITMDQWRGDSLSCAGHPLLETPAIDGLAAGGVRFANHWANAAPCGPSRACIYTGMYMHNHRSLINGTPLDARFTNVALEARKAGYDPVLFGYTDTSVDPRTVPAGDPALYTYESVLPGMRAVVHDPWEAGSLEWGKWLAARGVDVPSKPHKLYEAVSSYPGAGDHGSTWAPAQFGADETETAFMTDKLLEWLGQHGDEQFFVHVSYIKPHPPRRCPPGYHDLYSADEVPEFVGARDRSDEVTAHQMNAVLMNLPVLGSPTDEQERRQMRATYHCMQREVDDQLGRLFAYLDETGLAGSTLVVLTSDHGEQGGDHWLFEKLGYWDESYHVPLVIRDPFAPETTKGSVVGAFTESVDVSATILEWLGIETPVQVDGWPLTPFVQAGETPEHWRTEAHFEWDFRNPLNRLAEMFLAIPMEHCGLVVQRGEGYKYVQFAAGKEKLPPLYFDLTEDPEQLHDVAGAAEYAPKVLEATQDLLRWRLRNADRTLSGQMLTFGAGLVSQRDPWR
jgi:arylsulfatase A-like enzyme